MEVKKIMRERRLREAAENIQRKSASAPHESENSQKEPSLQRISRQISAYSSRPSSQYGDAESPPEWYQHEEGNHTQFSKNNITCALIFQTKWLWGDLDEKIEIQNLMCFKFITQHIVIFWDRKINGFSLGGLPERSFRKQPPEYHFLIGESTIPSKKTSRPLRFVNESIQRKSQKIGPRWLGRLPKVDPGLPNVKRK